MSTGLDASFCGSVSLLPPALLLAMLTSTSTADDAPGASIVAVVISFLDDKDDEDEEGPSQLALALGKENNVITMRSSGLQEPDPGDVT